MKMTLNEELDNVVEPREEEIEAGLLALAEESLQVLHGSSGIYSLSISD